jgi:hypothetical protein
MADAMEALWQYVDEEAANELGRIERHGFVAVGPFEPIILPFERHCAAVGIVPPLVAEFTDAMRSAGLPA